MAWTQDDITAVEQAILAIATGAQSYTINGRTVTKANLAELKKLRHEMRAESGDRQFFAAGRIKDQSRAG